MFNKNTMVKAGTYNTLQVLRQVEFGVYLEDGGEGILLPKRFVPAAAKVGDNIKVFIYFDGEDRLIATTQQPYGIVGDIVKLKALTVTQQGAFLDWGLMKDLFVPKSQQLQPMQPNGEYLIKIYVDEQTGRIAATERIEQALQNVQLTVTELQEVELIVLRRSDIGYVVIINKQHTGILHHNEIYRTIGVGDTFPGFIKKVYPLDDVNNSFRIDVVAGKQGYQRVEGESEKILRLLQENNGHLPYHDKTDPDTIYNVFGMSKKTFKMTLGKLYREQKIMLVNGGFNSVDNE